MFNDAARKILQLANQEAQRFNHEYVGTEHILLGIIKEGSSDACALLNYFGLDIRIIRLEVEKLIQAGPEMVTVGRLPQTPRAKSVLDIAIKEAGGKEATGVVGAIHILIGLLEEGEGVACQVLNHLGITTAKVRAYTNAKNFTPPQPKAETVGGWACTSTISRTEPTIDRVREEIRNTIISTSMAVDTIKYGIQNNLLTDDIVAAIARYKMAGMVDLATRLRLFSVDESHDWLEAIWGRRPFAAVLKKHDS